MGRQPSTTEPRRPIILIGAARSGTKMLRAAIATHPQVRAVPHDINFVWKHGAYSLRHDELRPENLSARSRSYIRSYLGRFAGPGERVVEKTVSNCLRVPFVREVVPDCQFVHLTRDGRDVIESSMRMWRSPPEVGRLFGKLRGFPPAALPTYAVSYVGSYVRRAMHPEKRVSTWGPRFDGIDDLSRERPLVEVCALQWVRCVEGAAAGLRRIPPGEVLEVRYEDVVTDPVAQLTAIFRFLGLADAERSGLEAASIMTRAHVGKGTRTLSRDEMEAVERVAGPLLRTLGYAQ